MIDLKANQIFADKFRGLTLTLLVLRGGANDHYPSVAANDPALLTHFLD